MSCPTWEVAWVGMLPGPAQRKTGQASSFTYLIALWVLSRLARLCLEVWARAIELRSYLGQSLKAKLHAVASRTSSELTPGHA